MQKGVNVDLEVLKKQVNTCTERRRRGEEEEEEFFYHYFWYGSLSSSADRERPPVDC